MRLWWIVIAVVMFGVAERGEAEGKFEIIIDGYLIFDFAFSGDVVWCATTEGILKYNRIDKSIVQYTEADGLFEYQNITDVTISTFYVLEN